MTKLLWPISEACEQVGLGRTKFYELIAAGVIESVVVGRKRLVPTSALEAFVARLRAEQTDDQSLDVA